MIRSGQMTRMEVNQAEEAVLSAAYSGPDSLLGSWGRLTSGCRGGRGPQAALPY